MASPMALVPEAQAVTEQDAGESYALVENADGAQAQAEQRLIDAGFTVCDNVEGLPETDENAENGLVIEVKASHAMHFERIVEELEKLP